MAIEFLQPDEKGSIYLPDHLDGLFNRLATQLRFHTISGKDEVMTLVHMCQIAEDYFKNESPSEKRSQ